MKTNSHKKHYLPTLDGLRGLACILVVLAHIAALTDSKIFPHTLTGSLGVLIFFSLSGFLMGLLYLSKEFQPHNVVNYAASRFSRITPAYYIAIFTYLSIDLLVANFYHMDLMNIVRSMLFISSVGVFWSIGPEVQFYVYFIGLWFAYYAISKKNYYPAIAIAIITLIFIATRTEWAGILLPSKLHIFIFGVMSAFLFRFENIRVKLTHPLSQLLFLVAIWVYLTNLISPENIFADLVFSAMIATAVASFSGSTIVTYILKTKFMRFIGSASFSIYLFHGPVVRMTDWFLIRLNTANYLSILFVFILAITIPSVFHVLVERRLNKKTKEFLLAKYQRVSERIVRLQSIKN